MTHPAQALQSPTAVDPRQVAQIIDLLEELHGVIGVENTLLAGGLPASLARTVVRKTQLAGELDAWLEVMRGGDFSQRSEPEEIAQLVSRLQSLRALMGQNTLAIKRSMDATRRRIDGIMRALRDEPRQAGIYGKSLGGTSSGGKSSGGKSSGGQAPGRFV